MPKPWFKNDSNEPSGIGLLSLSKAYPQEVPSADIPGVAPTLSDLCPGVNNIYPCWPPISP
jgi:hypothetical protein